MRKNKEEDRKRGHLSERILLGLDSEDETTPSVGFCLRRQSLKVLDFLPFCLGTGASVRDFTISKNNISYVTISTDLSEEFPLYQIYSYLEW